jgi:hypothetical protein
MGSEVTEHETHCSRCAKPYSYALAANEGGGLRYEVACQPCGEVYYRVSAPPLVRLRAAA